MKIVVLDGYAANPGDLSWAPLEALGELSVYDRTPADQTAARIADAELVLTNKTVLTRELIAGAKKLKYIGVLATGYNVVDVAAAAELGITVTNIPAYSTDSVAQMVFALLLEICQQVGHHSAAVQDGRWSANPDFCFWDTPLIELAGKTMGIIGFGRIGRHVGKMARALGMDVIAFNRSRSPEGALIADYVELDELLRRSDVISLHCPLFPETREIINKDTIAKMKDGVIIINNSRGPLVAEQDLADALNSGKVYAAGLDVVSSEPISGDNPLLHAKNCIITPHISWASIESRRRIIASTAENIRAWLAGAPRNVVNK